MISDRSSEVLYSVAIAVVLSTGWIVMAVLARWSDAIFLPQALRFGSAAAVLFCLLIFGSHRLPRLSPRLVSGAIAIGICTYVISPVLAFYGLRTISSGLGALAFVTLPVFFLLLVYREGKDRLYQHVFVVLGLLLFYVGTKPEADLRGLSFVGFFAILASMFVFLAGVAISRKLYWQHSAFDLNFWSVSFAAGIHMLLGLTVSEYPLVRTWGGAYWLYALYLGVVVTAVGSFFYRAQTGAVGSQIMTVLLPLSAIGIGYLFWRETPLNTLTALGGALTIGFLFLQSRQANPRKWACLNINNDNRRGDHLLCLLTGNLVLHTGESVPVTLYRISVCGFGLRGDKPVAEGQKVVLQVPFGWGENQFTLEGEIAESTYNDRAQMPWEGEIHPQNLNDKRWQVLLDFVARLSRAEE